MSKDFMKKKSVFSNSSKLHDGVYDTNAIQPKHTAINGNIPYL